MLLTRHSVLPGRDGMIEHLIFEDGESFPQIKAGDHEAVAFCAESLYVLHALCPADFQGSIDMEGIGDDDGFV